MNKPVIGITPSHNTENDDISVRPTYLRAIEAACPSFFPWRRRRKT